MLNYVKMVKFLSYHIWMSETRGIQLYIDKILFNIATRKQQLLNETSD